LQSPIPNVFIRVDFTVEKDEENQQKEYLNFLNNLREFLNRKEDEGW
jgi:hypothetical protein